MSPELPEHQDNIPGIPLFFHASAAVAASRTPREPAPGPVISYCLSIPFPARPVGSQGAPLTALSSLGSQRSLPLILFTVFIGTCSLVHYYGVVTPMKKEATLDMAALNRVCIFKEVCLGYVNAGMLELPASTTITPSDAMVVSPRWTIRRGTKV